MSLLFPELLDHPSLKLFPLFMRLLDATLLLPLHEKEKKRPLALLEKNESFCTAFASLGSTKKVSVEVIRLI